MSAAVVSDTVFSPDDIRVISRKAIGLSRRVAGDPGGTGGGTEARLELWKLECAGGSEELFRKRLEWDGIAPETAASLLTDEAEGNAAERRAEWVEFLAGLRRDAGESLWFNTAVKAVEDSDAPFAPACLLFLVGALERFQPEGPDQEARRRLVERAALDLLREICKIAAPVLGRRFQEYLRGHGAEPDFKRSGHYRAFTATLSVGGEWTEILKENAGLARLIAVICLGWARETREFYQRLDADFEELRSFFPEIDGAELRLARSGVSDRHQGAGTVRVLEFSNGRKLIYKRRPLELEADFHDLLRTLEAEGLESAPPALRVLPKEGYGWVEHAVSAPVKSAAELETWFQKAGGLLCLMYLLGGNDGHMENVVATSAGPVLVDLETLLQPGTGNRGAEAGTFSLAARRVEDSVMRTGLLPVWQRGRRGALYDIGGLTGEGGYESPAPRLVWENIGTDGIGPAWRRGIALGLNNLPVFNGARHSAAKHLPALCAGFFDTWHFIQARPDFIRTALSKWRNAPLRVLLRPTTHYAALLERSLAVEALKTGVDRTLIFEALRRSFVQNHAVRPPLWAAVDREVEALEDGDIPVFFVKAGGRDLLDGEGRTVVENAFSSSALEVCLAKIGGLTGAGLQRQVEMIGAAFIKPGTDPAMELPSSEAAASVDYDHLLATVPLISGDGFIKAATIIGGQIINAAIRGRDGFVTWLAPAFLHPDQREQRGISYYLYDGAAGISLFLAALAKVTGVEAAAKTALAALEPVGAILDSPHAESMISREGVGGCSGLGSLVYALTVVSRLLDAPELLERARRVSRLIDETRVARDQTLDILGGSAGAIYALLALHRATGCPDALERAKLCGEHLLSRAEPVGDDALAWPSWPDRLLLAGYSHGTAGAAAALAALFKITGDLKFAEAARAALRYERSIFDPSAGNWPVPLPGGGSRVVSTWCHGAPGILLSRLEFLGLFGAEEDARLLDEMETARRATLAAGLSGVDHLCCGTMGRVEILHAAAARQSDGRNLELAKLGATLTLRRAQQRKAFSLQTDPVRNSVFQPGFFRGVSGIGYTLLRLARPDVIPSVFTWDI